VRAKRLLPGVALLLVGSLAACSENNVAVTSAGPVSGALVGVGLGSVTADPFVGYAAGIGTQAAITALQKYLSRKVHQGEQDNIAAAVGQMQPGQEAAWKITFELPIGDAHGDVSVTRVIASPLTTCKEAAFTIITGKNPRAPRPVYMTTACQQQDGSWKWAEAEPATERWGFLQ
jgi:hypothetical protein